MISYQDILLKSTITAAYHAVYVRPIANLKQLKLKMAHTILIRSHAKDAASVHGLAQLKQLILMKIHAENGMYQIQDSELWFMLN